MEFCLWNTFIFMNYILLYQWSSLYFRKTSNHLNGSTDIRKYLLNKTRLFSDLKEHEENGMVSSEKTENELDIAVTKVVIRILSNSIEILKEHYL